MPPRPNVSMQTDGETRTRPAPSAEPRWGGLCDWLALLMLLAGSFVWPR
jgi:hypothetical protein